MKYESSGVKHVAGGRGSRIQRPKSAQIRHLGDTCYENTRRRTRRRGDKTELDAEKEARRPTVCFTASPVSTTSSAIFLAPPLLHRLPSLFLVPYPSSFIRERARDLPTLRWREINVHLDGITRDIVIIYNFSNIQKFQKIYKLKKSINIKHIVI